VAKILQLEHAHGVVAKESPEGVFAEAQVVHSPTHRAKSSCGQLVPNRTLLRPFDSRKRMSSGG